VIWWAAGFLAVGWLVIERGYPLPGMLVAGVGSWVAIAWVVTSVAT